MLLRKIGKAALLVINAIALTALFIAYSSAFISPDKWWLPSFFGLGFPLILIFNLLLIIFWLIIKPRYSVIHFLAILAGWGFVNRFIQFSGHKTGRSDLKIISYNVKFFVGEGNRSSKSIADSILEFLDKENADLICLQEVRLKTNNIFNLEQAKSRLRSIEHYQYARSSSTYGSVTLTRFPIIKMGEIRFEGTRNIAIYTDIVFKKDTVRVFNVHLQSYHIDPSKYSVIDSPDLTEDDDLQEVREMGSKFITAIKLRSRQARIINDYIKKSPYIVVVCGDFNDTPVSYTYRKICRNLKDSFVESGKGIARTYIGRLPSFRIDYILHGNEFRSYNYRQYSLKLSDHVPVSCDLVLK
jgi:endonuclease/exonuclease/phosphatase family metal-dependent hydrolase